VPSVGSTARRTHVYSALSDGDVSVAGVLDNRVLTSRILLAASHRKCNCRAETQVYFVDVARAVVKVCALSTGI
jgi:hypothetical protein